MPNNLITRIYFNNKCFYISEHMNPAFPGEVVVVKNRIELEEAFSETDKMSSQDILFTAGEGYYTIQSDFFSLFEMIQASGGLVRNEEGDILFIHRRGKWDLPKGKLEPYETLSRAAVREVSEETGLTQLDLLARFAVTYHLYKMHDIFYLKETHWFEMNGTRHEPLFPQYKEDITAVRWFEIDDLRDVFENTYRSIKELLDDFLASIPK